MEKRSTILMVMGSLPQNYRAVITYRCYGLSIGGGPVNNNSTHVNTIGEGLSSENSEEERDCGSAMPKDEKSGGTAVGVAIKPRSRRKHPNGAQSRSIP